MEQRVRVLQDLVSHVLRKLRVKERDKLQKEALILHFLNPQPLHPEATEWTRSSPVVLHIRSIAFLDSVQPGRLKWAVLK